MTGEACPVVLRQRSGKQILALRHAIAGLQLAKASKPGRSGHPWLLDEAAIADGSVAQLLRLLFSPHISQPKNRSPVADRRHQCTAARPPSAQP